MPSDFPPGWRIVSASVTGSAHTDNGIENQDAYACRPLDDGFVLAVADGAGSRRRAATGARLAVDAACVAAERCLDAAPAGAAGAPRFATTTLALFDAALAALTAADGAGSPADYATTLLALVARPPRYLYLSVGDGFLVVAHEGGGAHLVVPPADEPVGDLGSAVFLTSPDRAGDVRSGLIVDTAVHGVALCTDGLIEAVLAADQWPDGRQRLRAPDDFDRYLTMFGPARAEATELTRRLQSPEVAATSVDDKTMVLAVRS
jgi:hypothetical protein